MAIKFRQFKPPGIYLSDIQQYTGQSNLVELCRKNGIKLIKLKGNMYNPLSLEEARKLLYIIRYRQGLRYMKKLKLNP